MQREISNSIAFVDNANAGRYRGLSTIYIICNLFQQSKLAGDVELQNTDIAHFKFPRDVMKVSTLSSNSAVELELVDWFGNATSVAYGHLLID